MEPGIKYEIKSGNINGMKCNYAAL